MPLPVSLLSHPCLSAAVPPSSENVSPQQNLPSVHCLGHGVLSWHRKETNTGFEAPFWCLEALNTHVTQMYMQTKFPYTQNTNKLIFKMPLNIYLDTLFSFYNLTSCLFLGLTKPHFLKVAYQALQYQFFLSKPFLFSLTSTHRYLYVSNSSFKFFYSRFTPVAEYLIALWPLRLCYVLKQTCF